MEYHDIIIVGGGPAGSSCAWRLNRFHRDCLVIDKAEFPRTKLCAGWITPQVIRDLEMEASGYPYGIRELSEIRVSFFGLTLNVSANQYSIRRFEFDHWLLQRASVPVVRHEVRRITQENELFVIDDHYSCRYLVGAGGTSCPVYRTLFEKMSPRSKSGLVVCRELEFSASADAKCRLWFFRNRLPGYSWYVPKEGGYLNIGVGGFEDKLKSNRDSVNRHWDHLISKLKKHSLISSVELQPKGHSYYLHAPQSKVQIGNAFIVGDSAGLATRDLAEGIGPAVQSGIRVAESIVSGKPYEVTTIQAFSLHHPIFLPILKFFMH